jgi:hypothetical protein
MCAPNQSRRLSTLPHELERAGFSRGTINYHGLWRSAVERRYPAHQRNGIWHYYQADVPAIAAALGLPRIAAEPADAA